MVVTFANSISNQEEIFGEITRAGIEKGSVFFIENYVDVNHEMDSKKHMALLKILEACIKRADDNITFRWRKENETSEKSQCEIDPAVLTHVLDRSMIDGSTESLQRYASFKSHSRPWPLLLLWYSANELDRSCCWGSKGQRVKCFARNFNKTE